MIRKNPPIEPEERITPQHKDGIIDSKKTVDNPSPKLGEEVEYRISFKNTVEKRRTRKGNNRGYNSLTV